MHQSIEISSSKSLMNRALILQSYFPSLEIEGYSKSEDVLNLKESLKNIGSKNELYVGEGGTTLRFLALRVSRFPGTWILRGKDSLFRRPQSGLAQLMNQLGIESHWHENFVEIFSEGWKIPQETIPIDVKDSSQFATSLLLNACDLPMDLKFSIDKNQNSESYFDLSLQFYREMGLDILETLPNEVQRVFSIAARQKPKKQSVKVEIDLSSAFSIASLAALHQNIEIKNFPFDSAQPDLEFLNVFRKMGISSQKKEQSLIVKQTKALIPVEVDLKNCPDLFPVLAALCSQSSGVSRLKGARQLIHKESNRLFKTKELLDLCQIPNRLLEDGLEISGCSVLQNTSDIIFNPASDHRMAMAAAVMKSLGYKIKILHPEVVDKSFPEFWQMTGIQA